MGITGHSIYCSAASEGQCSEDHKNTLIPEAQANKGSSGFLVIEEKQDEFKLSQKFSHKDLPQEYLGSSGNDQFQQEFKPLCEFPKDFFTIRSVDALMAEKIQEQMKCDAVSELVSNSDKVTSNEIPVSLSVLHDVKREAGFLASIPQYMLDLEIDLIIAAQIRQQFKEMCTKQQEELKKKFQEILHSEAIKRFQQITNAFNTYIYGENHASKAAIIQSLTSTAYKEPLTFLQKIIAFLNGAQKVNKQKNFGCRPFSGDSGSLALSFISYIRVNSIIYAHANSDLRSAPKEIELYTILEGRNKDMTQRLQYLTRFTYDIEDVPIQHFDVPNVPLVRSLVFKIKSNWGNDEFTCISPFRVYGEAIG